MKQTYTIDKNDRKQYPMGAVSVEGGMHISFVSRATSCSWFYTEKEAQSRRQSLNFQRRAAREMYGA